MEGDKCNKCPYNNKENIETMYRDMANLTSVFRSLEEYKEKMECGFPCPSNSTLYEFLLKLVS
jgi:hypothetical protein